MLSRWPILNEQTLFHVAAKLGDVALGQKLLEYKAEVNFKDKFGNTPLIKITKENNPDCILGLLKAGAKSNFQNNEDKTAPLLKDKKKKMNM